MAEQRISRSFKDISLSFVPHPVTKDLQVLKNLSVGIVSTIFLTDLRIAFSFFNTWRSFVTG